MWTHLPLKREVRKVFFHKADQRWCLHFTAHGNEFLFQGGDGETYRLGLLDHAAAQFVPKLTHISWWLQLQTTARGPRRLLFVANQPVLTLRCNNTLGSLTRMGWEKVEILETNKWLFGEGLSLWLVGPLRSWARGLGRQAQGSVFLRCRILWLPGVPTAIGGSATLSPQAASRLCLYFQWECRLSDPERLRNIFI